MNFNIRVSVLYPAYLVNLTNHNVTVSRQVSTIQCLRTKASYQHRLQAIQPKICIKQILEIIHTRSYMIYLDIKECSRNNKSPLYDNPEYYIKQRLFIQDIYVSKPYRRRKLAETLIYQDESVPFRKLKCD